MNNLGGEQIFVGLLALVLGILGLVAAIHNHDWYYQLPKARWVEDRWGRWAARIGYLIVGLVLIALAAIIVCSANGHPTG